jgi:Chlorophyll A-B binding protein
LILSPVCNSLRAPLLSDELGCSPTLSILLDRDRYSAKGPFVYFDPLKFATDENFARLREAELKHGRVAMLAMAEIMLIPVLKSVDLVSQEFPESLVYGLPHLQPGDIFKVVFACSILEAYVFVQKDPKDMPGDYGTGFFGLRDKAAHEDKLVVELEHGRLAMVGFVGFLASDILTKGQSWLEQWLLLVDKGLELVYAKI